MVCYDQERKFHCCSISEHQVLSLDPGAHLYHVTYCTRRDSIMQCGLKLSAGGGTCPQRPYPPGIFFSPTPSAVFEFVPIKCRGQLVNVPDNGTSSPRTASIVSPKYSEKDIDIYRITVQDGREFYPDPFIRGKAVWREVAISPEHLELIRRWRGCETSDDYALASWLSIICVFHLPRSIARCKRPDRGAIPLTIGRYTATANG
jgi:hypothetical protein